MPYFEVIGYGRDTSRKRKRRYFAHNKEGAIYQAGDDGTIVESVTQLPDPPKKIRTIEPRSFFSKVAGTNQQNPDGQSRQDIIRRCCKAGMPLILRREPSNQCDPFAIALWIEVTALFVFRATMQIGYVGSHLSEELAELIDSGRRVSMEISQITGGYGRNYGVNIEITKW